MAANLGPPLLLHIASVLQCQLRAAEIGPDVCVWKPALLHRSCVRGALLVRETGHCHLLDGSVREWLETNRFIAVTSAGDCVITSKGSTWLDTNVVRSERGDRPSVRRAR